MIGLVLEKIARFIIAAVSGGGYVGIFVLMLVSSANIPIPSEVVLPFAGFLASTGTFNIWLLILIAAVGDTTGGIISYSIAERIEEKLRKNREFIIAEKWFHRFGLPSVFFGKMLPVIRAFIAFPAGLFGVKKSLFIPLTFLGSLIWSSALSYAGLMLGERWDIIGPYFKRFDSAIVAVGMVTIIWLIWHHIKANKRD